MMGFSNRCLLIDRKRQIAYSCNYIDHILIPITIILVMIYLIYFIKNSGEKLRWKISIGKKEKCIVVFGKQKRNGTIGKKSVWITIIIFGLTGIMFTTECLIKYKAMNEGWPGDIIVSHAGGEIDGYIYTNSKEAILKNYELGNRTFEMDFQMTSDNSVVCVHDWNVEFSDGHRGGVVESEKDFLSMQIFGRYTALSFGDLLQIMDEYPDMWIVTDTKYTEREDIIEQFSSMVETAEKLGLESVLDRIIVQIYNCEMYYIVKNIYPFKSWNFTLYQIWSGDKTEFQRYAKFCFENNIKSITMWTNPARKEIFEIAHEYGLDVYVHTENNVNTARQYIIEGVDGIYTDSILKAEMGDK